MTWDDPFLDALEPVYEQVLASPGWKVRAYIMKTLAAWECERCGNPDALEVHHLTYEHLGSEEPQELVVLCRACHALTHTAQLDMTAFGERHPESFRDILEHDRFSATWL